MNQPVVEEAVVRLNVRGRPLFEWRCTPTDLEALVIGRLYAERLVSDGRVAKSLSIRRIDDFDIEIDLAAELSQVARNRSATATIPSTAEFGDLFRALFAGVDERHESGGVHAAALASDRTIDFQAEDVGRHNTVDKVIGLAVLDGVDPGSYGMLVTARVSGEIARKVAQAGVAWLASRSIPTTLALRSARSASLPIIGRAAGKNAVVYQ